MLWRAGRPPRGGVRKACGEPPGRNQRERSRAMNRSAEDGEWSSPHDGGEGTGVPPRRTKGCAGDTVGKSVSDPGRPGIVHREGMAGIVRHSQTKGRETGNAKPGLKPPMVGADISASEGPTEAVPGVGSGRGTQERGQSKRPRIAAGRAATPVGSKRPTGGGRPRAVWQRRRATRGGGHGGSADKFAMRKTLRRHRGDPHGARRRWGSKDPGQRKVHSLIDKVYAPANLAEARRHVRDKKGGAGIDGLTIAAFAAREEERLAALPRKLRDRSYRPTPVKRVGIPKPDGGFRKLGIPSVTDRVVQQALVQKMAPIFEPHFADCSFGYRPGRSPHMAMRKVWQEINEGNFWILDADIRAFFDAIDQDKLVSLIAAEISDGRVLHLIRSFLDAGVIEAGKWHPTTTGVPQGGVASPLWSNIFLTPFDRAMTEAGYRLTRWADDFVVVCKTRQEAEAALALADRFLRETLGISLHPEKTRIVHVDHGFEFLGYKVKRGPGLRLPAYKRKT